MSLDLESVTGNVGRYPEIVFEPRIEELDEESYAIYGYRFKGLGQLYNFLKSNPRINVDVFGPARDVSSIENDFAFAGKPYPDALEQIVNYHDPKYREFLDISRKVNTKDIKRQSMFKSVNSVAGGIIRPQALATGDPHIYRTTKIVKHKKEITINATFGYPSFTTKRQVLNRAIILTNIIYALEKQGYSVKVNSFEICEEGNELIEIILDVKGTNMGVNYQALYRSLCDVEFFRRLGFRLIECADVKGSWKWGYGRTAGKGLTCNLLKLRENDLYFGTPDSMGIEGEDIEEDFVSAINHLGLNNKIDVEKEKVKVKRGVRDSSLYNKL